MKRKDTAGWWYCDNVIDRPNEVGLLHMMKPNCFITFENSDENYFDFEAFKRNAEVDFFYSADIMETDMTKLLTDAWNFMAACEAEEERLAALREAEEDEDY